MKSLCTCTRWHSCTHSAWKHTKHQSIHRSTTDRSILQTALHSYPYTHDHSYSGWIHIHMHRGMFFYCPLAPRETTLKHTAQVSWTIHQNQMQPDFSLISVMAARALACGECPCPHRLVAVKKLSFFQGTLTLTFFICVSLVCPKWSPGYCDMRIAAQRRKVNPRFEGALAPRRKGWKDLDILIASAVYSGSGKVGQICSKFVDSSSLALFEMRWMRSTHWHLSWSFQVPLSQGTRPGRLASKKHELQRVRLDIMQDVFLLWYNSRFQIVIVYHKKCCISPDLYDFKGAICCTETPTQSKPVCALQGVQRRRSTLSTFCLFFDVQCMCTIMHG